MGKQTTKPPLDELLQWHSGFDIRKPQDLANYQTWVAKQLKEGKPASSIVNSSSIPLHQNTDPELNHDDQEATPSVDPFQEAKKTYGLKKSRPPTEDGIKFWDAQYHGADEKTSGPKYKIGILPNCKASFFVWQLTAALFMVKNTISKDQVSGLQQEGAQFLVHYPPRGGFLWGDISFGKTYICNLFLNFACVFWQPPLHIPHCVLVSSGTVLGDWAQYLSRYFPDVKYLIPYGKDPSPTDSVLYGHHIKPDIMQKAPSDTTYWPQSYLYVCDQAKPEASLVVSLCTLDIWWKRVLTKNDFVAT